MRDNDIDRARRALETAENQFNYADADHRTSAARRLTAAMEDYNAAIAAAKVDAGLTLLVPGVVSSAGIRFFAALSESRALFCPNGLDTPAN